MTQFDLQGKKQTSKYLDFYCFELILLKPYEITFLVIAENDSDLKT